MNPPCRIYPQKIGSEDDVIDKIRLHLVVKNSTTAARIAFLSSKSRLTLELKPQIMRFLAYGSEDTVKTMKPKGLMVG